MKILIVDDNKENLALLDTLLKGFGYQVEQATNGQEALDKLKNDSYWMIISDILMPVMDGYELCRICKTDPVLRKIIFIFYTATYTTKEDEEYALQLGADQFLIKPMEPDAFLSAIRDIAKTAEKKRISPKKPKINDVEAIKKHRDRILNKLSKKVEALELEIDERKKIENELRNSEERLKILFEYAPDAYYLTDLKGNFIDGNITAEKMIGYKKDELIGKSFLKLKLLSAKEIVKATKLLKTNALGKATGPDEFILRRKDGTTIIAEIRTYPVKIKEKTLVLAIARDITERKKAEELIKTSLKEKEILLRELYHRTKNNMQVIASMLRLRARSVKSQELTNVFKDIENKILGLALVHQKLFESGDLSHLNLKDYIENLASLLKQNLIPSSKKIDILVQGDNIEVLLDTAMPIGIIINEFVTNSIKYAFPDKEKGCIHIHLSSKKNGEIVLTISDNGIGLPENFNIQKDGGLGLQTIYDLVVYQLDGSIIFKYSQGLCCTIVLKKELYIPRI